MNNLDKLTEKEYLKAQTEYSDLEKLKVQTGADGDDLSLFQKCYNLAKKLFEAEKVRSEKNLWLLRCYDNLCGIIKITEKKNKKEAIEHFETLRWFFKEIKQPVDGSNQLLYEKIALFIDTKIKSIYLNFSSADGVEKEELDSFNPTIAWMNEHKKFYGQKSQDYYNRFALNAVNLNVLFISEWVKRGDDLAQKFPELLISLAKSRRTLAEKTKSADSDKFGLIRGRSVNFCHQSSKIAIPKGLFDESENIPGEMTSMHRAYASNCSVIKQLVYDHLQKYAEDGTLNHTKDFGEFVYQVNIIDAKRVFDIADISKDGLLQTGTKNHIYFEQILNFREKYPDVPKNGYIAADIYLKIGDKQHLLTTYMTAFRGEKPEKDQPIHKCVSQRCLQDFLDHSEVVIFHSGDIAIQKYFIHNLAQLFGDIIAWDKKDPTAINRMIAEMHYKLAHFMYCHRGSAAIGEWLVKTIYKYHRFQLIRVKPDVMIDLKALSQPDMNKFIEEYVNYWIKDPTAKPLTA